MAKKPIINDDLDIEAILLRRIAESTGPTGSVLDLSPEDDPATPQPIADDVAAEKTDRRRKSKSVESAYEKQFLKPNVVQNRSVIYIDTDTKKKLSDVVRRLGWGRISVTAYADNILSHHLATFRDEINRLYRQKNNKDIL